MFIKAILTLAWGTKALGGRPMMTFQVQRNFMWMHFNGERNLNLLQGMKMLKNLLKQAPKGDTLKLFYLGKELRHRMKNMGYYLID